jgi:hypothetical protein
VKRPGPIAASVAAWTLGAGISIGVGLLALSLIGVGLTTDSGDHLTQPVDRAEAPPLVVVTSTPPDSAPPDSASATPSGSSAPTGPTVGPNRSIDTAGGNVVARCEPGGAYLLYWSPSPGFRAGVDIRGPAPVARLSFESSTREINVRVTCIGLTVHPSIEDDTSGH